MRTSHPPKRRRRAGLLQAVSTVYRFEMRAMDLAYQVAVGAARTAAPLAGVSSKLAKSLRGRRDSLERLRQWTQGRDRSRKLVWFHAASVGEGLQARVVMTRLRALVPNLQAVFTHTSPSAEPFAKTLDVDAADYLPWDGGPKFARLFDEMSPDLVVFTQREVWPGVVQVAASKHVPVALVAATLPSSASRLKQPGRWILRPTFERLASVLAIGPEDGARFAALGVSDDRVVVSGDPGIDSAWERASVVDSGAAHVAPFHAVPAPTLVAGSTWPADETLLIPAAAGVRKVVPSLRLIVVPHEPDDQRVVQLMDRLATEGWAPERLSSVVKGHSLGGASAVVVDSVGFLADLYTIGTIALVGGAYDPTGLHSVLEPAAAGLPVCFGPHHAGSRAALGLLEAGAARVATTEAELATLLIEWLTDPRRLQQAGEAARSYVADHRGAAQRTAEHLSTMLETGARRP